MSLIEHGRENIILSWLGEEVKLDKPTEHDQGSVTLSRLEKISLDALLEQIKRDKLKPGSTNEDFKTGDIAKLAGYGMRVIDRLHATGQKIIPDNLPPLEQQATELYVDYQYQKNTSDHKPDTIQEDKSQDSLKKVRCIKDLLSRCGSLFRKNHSLPPKSKVYGDFPCESDELLAVIWNYTDNDQEHIQLWHNKIYRQGPYPMLVRNCFSFNPDGSLLAYSKTYCEQKVNGYPIGIKQVIIHANQGCLTNEQQEEVQVVNDLAYRIFQEDSTAIASLFINSL